MALVDDKELKQIGTSWELILDGSGVITNMSAEGKKLHFRFDNSTPEATDSFRVLNGSNDQSERLSFVNQSTDSKIYGKGATGVVKVLVTRDIV